MSKYVPDVLSNRWVIIADSRQSRPDTISSHSDKKALCPFCPGNESVTPGEVFRMGKGEKDQRGWKVRVIPNKYPITDFHEVIIHSPKDDKDIEHLPESHVELILKAYKERFNFYRKKGQVLIFYNHGEGSGASIHHPHSQLVVIPSQINLDTLTREPLHNIVEDNTFFYTYCPDFSQWPYEIWIAPKADGEHFGDLTDIRLRDLATLLKKTLRQLEKIFTKNQSQKSFGYNYYIYPHSNWYLRIIPRFIHRAGFELGTGLNVNIVDPATAALEYKGMEMRMVSVLAKLKHVM
jgi:UDPglucose--hexose-1-phosphate uridylyltransferase